MSHLARHTRDSYIITRRVYVCYGVVIEEGELGTQIKNIYYDTLFFFFLKYSKIPCWTSEVFTEHSLETIALLDQK